MAKYMISDAVILNYTKPIGLEIKNTTPRQSHFKLAEKHEMGRTFARSNTRKGGGRRDEWMMGGGALFLASRRPQSTVPAVK